MSFIKFLLRFIPLLLLVTILVSSFILPVCAVDSPSVPSGGTEIGTFTYPPVELPFTEPDSWYGLYFKYPSGTYSSFTFIFDFPDLDSVEIDVLYTSTSSGWTLTFTFVGYKNGQVVNSIWDSDEVYIWRYYAGRLNPCNITLNGSGGGIFQISDSGSAIYQSWHSSDTAKIKIRPSTQIGTSNMNPPVWLFGDAAVTYMQFIHVKQTISHTFRVWFETLLDNLYSWFYDVWYAIQNIFNGLKQWFASLFTKLDDILAAITGNADSEPVAPDGGSSVDDYNNLEQNVIGSTNAGSAEIGNVFSNISGSLSNFIGGFALVSGILGAFLKLPFFGSLAYISLGIGIFASIMGVATSVYSRFSNASARQNHVRRG